MQGRVDLVGLVIHTEVVYPPEDHPITVLTGLNLRVTLFMDERSYRYAKPSSTDRTIKHTIHYSLRLEFETTLIIGGRPENVLSCFVKISSRVWATGLLNLVATPLNKQETFEKYWAHSPGGATVARRLRIDVNDNDDNNNDNDNALQRGPLWPHTMGPITVHWPLIGQVLWANETNSYWKSI